MVKVNAEGRVMGYVASFRACLLLAVSALAVAQVQPGTTNKCERLLDALNVRMHANKIVRPAYPEQAIRSKTAGLVVAEVCVPAGKTVADVRISSAPSEVIAESVKQALSQWTFRTWFQNNAYSAYGGKIVFYFVEQSGEWKVLEPTDSFYVGPRFALKQQRPMSR